MPCEQNVPVPFSADGSRIGISSCSAQKRVFTVFGPPSPNEGALFSKDFAVFSHARGYFARSRCTRRLSLRQRARQLKQNIRRFSRKIGPVLAPAAARILRPRRAHAKMQNRPGGGDRPVFLERFHGCQTRIMLLAVLSRQLSKGCRCPVGNALRGVPLAWCSSLSRNATEGVPYSSLPAARVGSHFPTERGQKQTLIDAARK